MNQEVMILTGAGQIGMAIARRVGYGKKIVIGDKSRENAENISEHLVVFVRRNKSYAVLVG